MKRGHRRWIIGGIVLVLVVAATFVLGQNLLSSNNETSSFIVANPFDLAEIKAISKYRSCEGHNYSGRNADAEEETYRTMKHYIESIDELAQSTQQVKVFAPFNGKVSQRASDSRGLQVYLSPDDGANGWNFIYFHIDLLPAVDREGSQIIAGEHIGYANLQNAANFDIAMRQFGFRGQLNDSPFLHMTEDILAQFAAVGITQNNIVISKEERDSSPCQLAPGESGRDAQYAQDQIGKAWVQIQ